MKMKLKKFNANVARTQIKDSLTLRELLESLTVQENYDYLEVSVRMGIFKRLSTLYSSSVAEMCTNQEPAKTNQLTPRDVLAAINLKLRDIMNVDQLYHDLQAKGTHADVNTAELRSFMTNLTKYNQQQIMTMDQNLKTWQITGQAQFDQDYESLGVSYAVNDVHCLNQLLNALHQDNFDCDMNLTNLQELCGKKINQANHLLTNEKTAEVDQAKQIC